MEEKKDYIKPEMTVIEVEMEPLMQASGFDPNSNPYSGPYN